MGLGPLDNYIQPTDECVILIPIRIRQQSVNVKGVERFFSYKENKNKIAAAVDEKERFPNLVMRSVFGL